jgi:hypothetical protein
VPRGRRHIGVTTLPSGREITPLRPEPMRQERGGHRERRWLNSPSALAGRGQRRQVRGPEAAARLCSNLEKGHMQTCCVCKFKHSIKLCTEARCSSFAQQTSQVAAFRVQHGQNSVQRTHATRGIKDELRH